MGLPSLAHAGRSSFAEPHSTDGESLCPVKPRMPEQVSGRSSSAHSSPNEGGEGIRRAVLCVNKIITTKGYGVQISRLDAKRAGKGPDLKSR